MIAQIEGFSLRFQGTLIRLVHHFWVQWFNATMIRLRCLQVQTFKCILKICLNNTDKETWVYNEDHDFILQFWAHICIFHHEIFDYTQSIRGGVEMIIIFLLMGGWYDFMLSLQTIVFRSTGFCMSAWCQSTKKKI